MTVTVLHDTIRWEEKALMEAGRRSGADVRMRDCRSMSLDLDGPAPDAGAVLQRCVSYYRSVHSTAALEGLGVRVVNCLESALLAGNKLFTHMLLRRAGVPCPRASASFSREAALESFEGLGYPRVIKPAVGSWGRLVSQLTGAESAACLLAERETLHPSHHVHYTEEVVRRPPRDIRAIVVGDEVVAAIYRNSAHWKTNMALEGRAEPCPVDGRMEDLCVKARDAVKGQIVGVDLMEDEERGLLVHEVNNTTEFKNTVRVCGVDIPSKMIEYAASVA